MSSAIHSPSTDGRLLLLAVSGVPEAGVALAVCRAVRCSASRRREELGALRSDDRRGVGAHARRRDERDDALCVVDAERPHAMVAFGPYEQLVSLVRERFPAMRIVTDRDTPGASAVATSPDDVREALRSLARPGGPILEQP